MNVQLESARVEMAHVEHLSAVKRLADKHKLELGFINLGMLRKAIETGSLLVATLAIGDTGAEAWLVGFVHFYVRRDSVVTLYSIVVAQDYRQSGLGRQLFAELVRVACSCGKTEIRLKCPIELPANAFYEHLGLKIACVEEGKHRRLNVWTYTMHSGLCTEQGLEEAL